MTRGRPLESAIFRALKHYERAGRIGESEKKQLKRLWNGTIIGGARDRLQDDRVGLRRAGAERRRCH
jgi:hypothetical protein